MKFPRRRRNRQEELQPASFLGPADFSEGGILADPDGVRCEGLMEQRRELAMSLLDEDVEGYIVVLMKPSDQTCSHGMVGSDLQIFAAIPNSAWAAVLHIVHEAYAASHQHGH
ncbi:MAG: hypothetical protein QOJ29_3439 [Thermoleophilaceae bacterium]|nr:hypothetical protein [Thermoleophilaceae bacterium]